MAHKTSAPGGGDSYELIPAGSHVATCCIVAFIGWHPNPFQSGKLVPKTVFSFELADERNKEGKPFTISLIMRDSLHVKAEMRKMLENWRSKPFTNDELRGFEITKVLGQACMVSVIHKDSNGEKKARIGSVSKLPKTVTKPAMTSPPLYYTIEPGDPDCCDALLLPDWLQKLIRNAKQELGEPLDVSQPPAVDDTDSDTPF